MYIVISTIKTKQPPQPLGCGSCSPPQRALVGIATDLIHAKHLIHQDINQLCRISNQDSNSFALERVTALHYKLPGEDARWELIEIKENDLLNFTL